MNIPCEARSLGWRCAVCWACCLLLASQLGFTPAFAQAVPAAVSPADDWQGPVRQRLQDIYQHGKWRAQPLRAEWLPDSSGFVMREPSGDQPGPWKVHRVETGLPLKPALEVPEIPAADPRVSPDGTWRIEHRGHQLTLIHVSDGSRRPMKLTGDDPQPGDRADVLIRSPTWSPDGTKVLFTEIDESEVPKRAVLVPSDPSYPDVRHDRFARVGGAIAKRRVGLWDITQDVVTWLPLDAPEEGFYLGQVQWAGNSHEVLVETLSRFRDRREFLLVNVDIDQANTIFSETDDAWVDASQQRNLGLMWIDEGQRFVVISEKDGWRHAYLYSREGRELANLTPGDYDIIDRAVIDPQRNLFYFYASPENATQKYLYRVPLDGSQTPARVTPPDQPGTHDYHWSPDRRWAFHTYSRFDVPPITTLVQMPDHRPVRVLQDNANLRKQMQVSAANPTEFLQLDIGAGVTLDAWLMKPHDFDPTKKYPVFVYVYGEPHAQTVLDGWATVHDQFHRTIADLGYLVISIDNRGTPAPKGAAWRRSVFGSLGPLSTTEQAVALREFARMDSYVDLSRVGIWGWSGGGSNTLNAMFRQSDLYHVGIAVVPKPQPHLYNAWFQEIFMRTPAINPQGYQTSAAFNYADGLQGKLLIITGSGETNTHIQIIEDLVDRLIELGKPFDYMVYPNRDHGLRAGTGTVVDVRLRVIRYVVEHLPRGGR